MRRFTLIVLAGFLVVVSSVTAFRAFARSAITRAEAVALLVDSQPNLRSRVQWYIGHMPPMPLYLDANPQAWYGPYLETAFEAGIINGNADRSFRPKSNITMAEAALLLTNLRSRGGQTSVVLAAPGSAWTTAALVQASSLGISLPNRRTANEAISLEELYAMMRSAGVGSPETIALSINPAEGYLPKPKPIVAIQPITQTQQPRPVVQQTRPVQQTTTQPVQRIQSITQPKTTTTANVTPVQSDAFSINMPTLGIKDLAISHPDDLSAQGLLVPLKYGVGHLFSYPGGGGKILIYGHSSGYPWDLSPFTKIFRRINELNLGDKVYINYDGDQYAYQVTLKEAVPANDTSRYQGGDSEELILFTCWPPDSISQRYLVHAKPI